MILKYNVTNQTVKRTGKELLANHSENYLELQFQFNSDWNGLAKFLLVLHPDGSATRLGLTGDKVVIPASLLTGEKLTFTLYGVKSITDGIVRVTTHRVVLKLLESGYTDEFDNPIDESGSTDIVEQIYLAIGDKADATHNHNDLYYTKAEVEALINGLLNRVHLDSTEGIVESGDSINLRVYVVENGVPLSGATVNIYEEE